MQNLAKLIGGGMLLTLLLTPLLALGLLAGCSPDVNASSDASAASRGTGTAAATPGIAGGGPQNSGGDTSFLAKVAGAPDRVARRGIRRVELYYELPGVLRWFTGNIGLHHIHHLSSRIPNYRLRDCLNANPELRQVRRLTLAESWKAIWLALWDEEHGRLVGFRQLESLSRDSPSRALP